MADKPKKRWDYRTMRFPVVEELCHVPDVLMGTQSTEQMDAYKSLDANSAALNKILDDGFRWVRTDYPPDDWAIAVFEKEIEIP